MVVSPFKNFLQEVPDRFFVVDNKDCGHRVTPIRFFRSYLCWVLLSREKLIGARLIRMMVRKDRAVAPWEERLQGLTARWGRTWCGVTAVRQPSRRRREMIW